MPPTEMNCSAALLASSIAVVAQDKVLGTTSQASQYKRVRGACALHCDYILDAMPATL